MIQSLNPKEHRYFKSIEKVLDSVGNSSKK